MVLYGNTLQKRSFNFSGPNGIASIQLEPRHCANSLMVLRDMVKSGYGITVLPDSHTHRDAAQGRMLPSLEEWKLSENGVYAVYPSPRRLTPKLRAFIDFLSDHLTLEF